jgi:nickel-dependent lactate racemase
MRARVDYQDGVTDFEIDETKLVGSWEGPENSPSPLSEQIGQTLEKPINFPPLRQLVIPDDRVVIAFDTTIVGGETILQDVVRIIQANQVESITVIIDGRELYGKPPALPEGVTLAIHDPSDRNTLAYLAATNDGRRIYLNSLLTDADCVIPIGRLGYSDALDLLGPWSVIEPGLSDSATLRTRLLDPPNKPVAILENLTEVSWLLGCQFQIGVVPGRSTALLVLAGETNAVLTKGTELLDATWRFQAIDRADLVIAGIGGPGRGVSPADFARGLRTALRAVSRGGKIALLSRGDLGTLREALLGPALFDRDFQNALAWADIYLMSNADAGEIEELGMISFDRPEQAAKLMKNAHSVTTISQADRTRVVVTES